MKDPIFEYMIDKDIKLQDLHLDSPNLVSDDCWRKLFTHIGSRLQSLKLWNLDSAFDDETAQIMTQNCTSLRRLKLKYFWKPGDASLQAISTMKTLEHLSLHFIQETSADAILHVVSELGPNLRSLSLEKFENADDRLVAEIHNKCQHLDKLRINSNAIITDQALKGLFHNWSNPALSYVDFSSLRDVDMSNPDGPEEPVGLAGDAFIALMAHSGSRLASLNISSCRHVPREAFEEVFAPNKTYPELRSLDISFSAVVDDFIAQCIFRSCPSLQKLVVFGCFRIREVPVPKGLAVIGTVAAKLTVDGVEQKALA